MLSIQSCMLRSRTYDESVKRLRTMVRQAALALLYATLASGCATDADRTRAEGAGTGAVVGGALGALFSHGNVGGIAAGAAVGGLAGGLFGNHVANEKQAYATREDQLQASIAHAQQVAQQARTYNQQLQKQITSLEQTREQLQHQVVSADLRHQAMLDDKRKTTAMIRQTNGELASVRQEISNQQSVLRTASTANTTSQQPSASIEKVSSSINDLQVQASELERAQAQLQLIDQRRAY